MILKRRTILAACLMLSAFSSFSQTKSLEGINSLRNRSTISPIFSGQEVQGYMVFLKADKADKKNDNYSMLFYDQDLNEVKDITIQKPRNYSFLVENSFNGNAFGFYFYNSKEKTLEMETYDTSLNKIASKTIKDLSAADNMILKNEILVENNRESSSSGLNLAPVPGKGFLRNSYDGMGKGFNLEMYDDQLNQKWKISTDKNSKLYEILAVSEITGNYILGTIARRDGMLSKKMDFFLVAYDVNTGKKIFEKNIETGSKEQLSMNSFSFDPTKQEFVVFGEYYKPEDKPMVDKSLGFFVKRFNNAGKETTSKFYAWDKEVKAKLPAAAKESMTKGFINFTHKFQQGPNGKSYIVSEQFRVAASGGAIAAQALGAKVSSVKGYIGNMIVFVLNEDQTLADVKYYTKDESEVFLPAGAAWLKANTVGLQLKSKGQFGYQFMQKGNETAGFNSVYIDWDKEKGEGTKKIIGNIIVKEDGSIAHDKINATSNSNASFTYPGKPGYLMLADFVKKDKKLTMKLVKLNS